jgi:hypothetical protein
MASDNSIRDRFVSPLNVRLLEAKARPPQAAGSWQYDPVALGDRIDGYIDYAEDFYLVRDENLFTSLFNTFVSTTATVAHGATSILRVGTGAAMGLEQIKNAQDGWDVAIGASRVLSDAGEIAGTAIGVAGMGARIAKAGARAIKLTKATSASAAAVEGTSTNAAATVTKRTKRIANGRVITEPDLPPRTIAEHGEVRIQHNYRSNDHPPAQYLSGERTWSIRRSTYIRARARESWAFRARSRVLTPQRGHGWVTRDAELDDGHSPSSD